MIWFSLLIASAQEPTEPQTMVTSWYGDHFRGRLTASGLKFDPDEPTAAHKTLPFGTRLKVTYPATGRSIEVRVTDRGPYVKGRHLDLSAAAAKAIGLSNKGVDTVEVVVLEVGSPRKRWPFLSAT